MIQSAKQKLFSEQYEKRGRFAQPALLAFRLATHADIDDAVSDLLADLMHWCDKHKHDFESELARARDHYGFEKNEG